MRNYMYVFGAFVLTLAMSGVPALALAESEQGEGESARVQITAIEATREEVKQGAEVSREQEKKAGELSARPTSTRPAIKGGDDDEDEFELELDDDQDRAYSASDLKKKIENRKHELDDEEASTTPKFKNAMKNANEVRLAVHALLASKDLVGGIGQKVSEIAKEVDHSVASTTKAEAKIQSRGFLSRIFFGGDKASAEVISEEAAKNQTRIDALMALLADTTITPEVKATLDAQVTALKDAQARLQALADKEKSAWGIFSWRF